jgi:polar amino acid transport system substrate-binding protein
MKSIEKIALLLLVALVFSGCATATTAPDVIYNPLRVGVTPDSPPLIFKLDGNITGMEADLALRLGAALNRPVQFIDLPWDGLIPALMAGKIDIIMSGMTITEVRKAVINFSYSYLKSGLATLMRADDAYRFNSVESILGSESTVGAMVGTTSETFVRKNFPNALTFIPFRNASDVVYSLKTKRIDLFVYDAPSIVWLVSENEGRLTGFWQLLNVEYLGWGVRKGDDEFLKQVNSALTNCSQDGTLRQIIIKWLPNWKNFD